jgi:quercetin dioxygenase-like cupin family protein
MRRSTMFLGFLLSCAFGAVASRGQSQEVLPKPGAEVQKLAVMVGRFTNEGEVKAGALGPNSPAMKVSGIDECRWTAGGFGLACTETVDIGGTKETETYLMYYDPISKQYEEHGIRNTGEAENQTGTVSGDTWTWPGVSTVGGKVFHQRYIMKFVSKDSYEYTDEWGEGDKPVEVGMSGKCTRVVTASVAADSSSFSESGSKPLLLEKNEGETRLWRPEPGEGDLGGFILKVTPKANGSQHLVVVAGVPGEDMAPGDAIPTHKHLEQDELVLIEKGTIHAHVGDQEGDLHAGGMVFIPQRTWVSLKNVGTEPASIVAIFSAPGFEDHLRCESVPAGEKPTTISRAEENECDRLGHVVYRDRGEKDPGN